MRLAAQGCQRLFQRMQRRAGQADGLPPVADQMQMRQADCRPPSIRCSVEIRVVLMMTQPPG